MLKKILFLLGFVCGPALAFTPTYYIQSTSALQSGATFYVSSGTIMGPLMVGTTYFETGNPLLVNADNAGGGGLFGECIQIGGYGPLGDSCFTQDVGTSSVAGEVIVVNEGVGKDQGNGYGIYEESNLTTDFPFHTYGAYFYASFGNYFTIGMHSSAGEVSGATSENRAGDFDASGKSGTNIIKGVYSLAQGAGTSYGGFFVSQATTNAIGVYVQGSTDAIQIGGGDLNTNGSAGTSGQVLLSAGKFNQPYWGSDTIGTSTNSSAPIGFIGQYVSTVTANNINLTNTTTWQTMVSTTVTAGDWDFSGVYFCSIGTGGTLGMFLASLNTTGAGGGNSGDNAIDIGVPATSIPTSGSIPNVRESSSSSITVYANIFGTFGSGNPNCSARLSGRRIR